MTRRNAVAILSALLMVAPSISVAQDCPKGKIPIVVVAPGGTSTVTCLSTGEAHESGRNDGLKVDEAGTCPCWNKRILELTLEETPELCCKSAGDNVKCHECCGPGCDHVLSLSNDSCTYSRYTANIKSRSDREACYKSLLSYAYK